ncbi:putative pleckstrin-likey domain-containing family G member 5 isoform X2 [Penaeus vannamei]|uniref:Putative pleckstrin-likey domain-containing family G member 5 isoform X2 n=2 Tax=Penaeus vannamei TaxID=6689 RepID=A0A423TYB7_PENVA|nr:putative pleckstrin-likey domain-containing family G member 5 isoform X2 [Penaeus vannamei]
MISHVETFVSNVNSALRHKHEQERLRDIAKRIEAYDAVEARDDELERVVRNYSELNLTQPMPGCPEHLPRHILHHGDLRLRDPHTKMDVHVFLFTDLLLITKVTQRKAEKVKVIRPPYHVERLVLVELKDCTSIGLVSVNEWNVAVAAFTLQCPDQRTHRTWYDALKRAKEQYKEAQQARDVLVYDDMSSVGHLVPRSPRPGSSRASRVSSLAHSHSGSIDLNDPSPGSTHHPPSVDLSEKQDSKDTSIHKRLSWNYGQGPPPTSRDLGSDQGKLGRQKHAVKSISCESMHSSSGVSSTSSLHRSMGSELEALENIDDNELEDGEGTVVDLTVSDCTSLKISPHISTTYICHDTDITLGVCSQYITQPNNATEPTEGCENLVKIDVSETDPGISSVQITVTEGASSSSSNLSSTTPSSDGAPGKTDGLRMREILLNDASVEASDV